MTTTVSNEEKCYYLPKRNNIYWIMTPNGELIGTCKGKRNATKAISKLNERLEYGLGLF